MILSSIYSYRQSLAERIFMMIFGVVMLLGILAVIVIPIHATYMYCNGYFFRDGTVIDKEFDPEHTYTVYDPALEMPVTRTMPDRYYLTIEKEVKGKLYVRTIRVHENAYYQHDIGDYYDWET